jgi:5-methylcytosine-specific restriction endonuclease McrA
MAIELAHQPAAVAVPKLFATYGRRCADCGRSDRPLEVHHVNGDPTDSRIRNLIPLCRDCHHKATFPGIRRDNRLLRQPGAFEVRSPHSQRP